MNRLRFLEIVVSTIAKPDPKEVLREHFPIQCLSLLNPFGPAIKKIQRRDVGFGPNLIEKTHEASPGKSVPVRNETSPEIDCLSDVEPLSVPASVAQNEIDPWTAGRYKTIDLFVGEAEQNHSTIPIASTASIIS